MANKKWLWFADAQYRQACCRCGGMIPPNRERNVLNRDVNPVGTAIIKHISCPDGRILYNGSGKRIEAIDIPDLEDPSLPKARVRWEVV